ncbi:MAG TPA: alpha/beta hydrolase [Acidimicrobiia bacterium]|nr:alpha/beta hydrolase [Acidimicrobiia bacterium]
MACSFGVRKGDFRTLCHAERVMGLVASTAATLREAARTGGVTVDVKAGEIEIERQGGGYHVFPKDRTHVASDGTPLAYSVRGEGSTGTTFHLVNGWSCSDVYWAGIAPRLEASGHRVVVADHRGHGASGLPRRPGYRARNITRSDMSLERVAADHLEILAAEGIDGAVLVGHSMGVQVALEAYRQAPERVSALVCIAGPYENPIKTFYGRDEVDRVFPVAKYALHVIPRLLLPAWRLLGRQYRLGHRLALLTRAAGPKVTARMLAPYIEHLTSRDPLVLFKLVESMREHSATDLLPEITSPILIVAGKQDPFTPVSVQRRMHALAPESELIEFPEGRHTLPLEEPAAIAAAIEEFIARRLGEADAGSATAAADPA